MGDVMVSGGKNPALAILPGTLLCDEPCTVENLPVVRDIQVMLDILESLGAKVTREGTRVTVDPRPAGCHVVPEAHAQRIRASTYFLGVLLGRFGRAEVAFPGGCAIGERPIDQHLKGLQILGADIGVEDNGVLKAKVDGRLRGREIYLDMASVGATINLILAGVKAEGVTTIVNAAKEPHVVDLANFLNSMGASIKGAGTDTIRIRGVQWLHGCTYSVIPDQIEAGTWMVIAAATQGDLTIHRVIPPHLEAISAKLVEMGADVTEGDDWVRVRAEGRPRSANIKTLFYPGFPTDMQQPMSVLLSTAQGVSIVTETIFEGRYTHINQLRRMGARIRVEDRVAVIEGVPALHGAPVAANDLRAGAALVVAGLMAGGETSIRNVKYIDRGYEDLVGKLRALGADIRREWTDEEDDDLL